MGFWLKICNDLENIPRQRSKSLWGFANPRGENISPRGFFTIPAGIFSRAKNFHAGIF